MADGGVNHIVTQYEYADIPLVSAEGAWLAQGMGFVMAATVTFENATVEYSSANTPTVAVFQDGKKTTPPVPQGSGYQFELQYFVDCIHQGVKTDRLPFAESARAVAITEAEIKSVKTGRAVNVPSIK